MSAIATARFWQLVRSGRLATRGRPVVRFLRSGGLRPKKISFPRLVNQRVMPRLYRRGFGLGGMMRRRKRRVMGKRVYRKKTQNKVHSFIRWCDKDTSYPGVTGPNQILELGTNQNLAYSFKLDNLVNPSDFTNLYDMYRINKIILYLEPDYDTTASGNALGNPNGRKIRVVHDYNDNNALSQEDDYLEYSNCKSYYPWSRRGIKVTLYPKINNAVENVAGSVNAFTSMNSNRVWLNIADDEVPHFGIKIFIPSGLLGSENARIFKVRAKYHISLKNSK